MKNAIITGATGGIGLACVLELVKRGFTVTAMGTREVFDGPEEVLYVRGSIAETADRQRLLDEAVKKFGPVDTLVNVAGVAPLVRNDILDMTEESYDRVMGINTKGVLFMTQLAAKHMVENARPGKMNGTIVNISSLSAYTSSVSRGEYCISKAGVSMITKLFADRLAEYNITVNEVRPGIIHTGMTEKVQSKYDALIEDGLLPIKRWGEPEDVAKAVAAFCCGEFPYTTGQSFDVDGGFHIRRL
ncbi:MAG: 3-ketoacyl-ACP reductase [Oscillospiraceae bacterium]|nr:3-ketoacyl-ACP reductase [Oscillospiraceae bacterium]